jgi:hypothetical protein
VELESKESFENDVMANLDDVWRQSGRSKIVMGDRR